MPEIWKPQSIEVYRHWVDTIIREAQDKLTVWETEFVDNMDTTLTMRINLSEKQAAILERIYAEKTS
jgi:hypothetical protein